MSSVRRLFKGECSEFYQETVSRGQRSKPARQRRVFEDVKSALSSTVRCLKHARMVVLRLRRGVVGEGHQAAHQVVALTREVAELRGVVLQLLSLLTPVDLVTYQSCIHADDLERWAHGVRRQVLEVAQRSAVDGWAKCPFCLSSSTRYALPHALKRHLDGKWGASSCLYQKVLNAALCDREHALRTGDDGAATPAPPAAQLSEREVQVLRYVSEGVPSRGIAELLDMGVRTVESHRRNLKRKLGVSSNAGLVRFAIRHFAGSL